MSLVRLEKDWKSPDIRRQTPDLDGRWGDLEITEDPVEECDLLIVLNRPWRDIRVRVPPGNKWLFSQESPIEQYRWHTTSFPHFDRVFTFWDASLSTAIVHDQTALPWHVGRSYRQLKELSIADATRSKRDAVSWVTSNASHKEGHKVRMRFKDFLGEQGFAFDLFGRGFDPVDDKFDALLPYKYSIAIENYACADYWTEKLADCFLSWTVPIYAGATNILSYFPADSMILVDPTDEAAALRTIRAAIDNDHFGRHADAIAEARRLVLDKYQFFPNLARLQGLYAAPAGTTPGKVSIPANDVGPANRATRARRAAKSTLDDLLWRFR